MCNFKLLMLTIFLLGNANIWIIAYELELIYICQASLKDSP